MEENTKPQGFKEKIWEPIAFPVIALMVICLVCSLLLGLTNSATAPLIEQNTIAAANEARMALLPEADGFEELEVPDGFDSVTSIYKATNGVGYVIEAWGRGYGGQVPAMTAFDEAGNIKGVTFLSNSETPGLGKNLETDGDFMGQFSGLPAAEIAYENIDGIASATISSKAALNAVNTAVAAYSQVAGDGSVDANAGASEKPDSTTTEEGGAA